jgi:hypothetical protein
LVLTKTKSPAALGGSQKLTASRRKVRYLFDNISLGKRAAFLVCVTPIASFYIIGAPVKIPERTTAAAYPQHLKRQVVADSAALHWPGSFVRRYKLPRVVDRFLVPATPEPLISCQSNVSLLTGVSDGKWITPNLSLNNCGIFRPLLLRCLCVSQHLP